MIPKKELADTKGVRMLWNERAAKYDDYYKNFRGAVEQYVDLELLKRHLPRNKNARILDAAGGTGRITLPLARMGYQVTLCDISPEMLKVAQKKMLKEGVRDKVTFFECNVCKMSFPDENFDFVICYGGGIKAVKELARVTRRKGLISMCLSSRTGTAISKFREDPGHALELLTSKKDYDCSEQDKYRVVNENDARTLMKREGIKIIKIYAYDIWNVLAIPPNVLRSRNWDEDFFDQTVEIMLELSEEPSVRGISRRWAMYGRKE